MVSPDDANRWASKSGSTVTARARSVRKPVRAPDAVDQMPLNSLSSVAARPSRALAARSATPPGVAARTVMAGRDFRRSTQVRTFRMSDPSKAAA